MQTDTSILGVSPHCTLFQQQVRSTQNVVDQLQFVKYLGYNAWPNLFHHYSMFLQYFFGKIKLILVSKCRNYGWKVSSRRYSVAGKENWSIQPSVLLVSWTTWMCCPFYALLYSKNNVVILLCNEGFWALSKKNANNGSIMEL